mmetsp:Transcript_2145/g.5019  ORF Transcript_2145/g.5019 Transcript_2145/m.5019 type:complete len:203 (+) Transcript_2145:904-1512(+)
MSQVSGRPWCLYKASTSAKIVAARSFQMEGSAGSWPSALASGHASLYQPPSVGTPCHRATTSATPDISKKVGAATTQGARWLCQEVKVPVCYIFAFLFAFREGRSGDARPNDGMRTTVRKSESLLARTSKKMERQDSVRTKFPIAAESYSIEKSERGGEGEAVEEVVEVVVGSMCRFWKKIRRGTCCCQGELGPKACSRTTD